MYRLLVAVLALVCATEVAAAQDLNTQTLRPTSPGDADLVSVETARVGRPGALSMGVFLTYVNDPLVVVDEGSGERVAVLLANRSIADLRVAYGLVEDLEVGAGLPVVLLQTGDGTPMAISEGGQLGLGDLRLFGRWRFFGRADQGLSALAGVQIGLPTAANADLVGDGTVSAHPSLVGEWREGNAVVAANLGARFRGEERIGDLSVGSAFVYRLGAAFRPFDMPLTPLAELAGEVAGGDAAAAPLELRGAMRWWATPTIALTAGYGRGLVHGYGAPDHRLFASMDLRPGAEPAPAVGSALAVRVPPPNPDPDGDGLIDGDECPDTAEDYDGFQDRDGCPEGDNDGDGLADQDDACPRHAEDADGFGDEDGCPDPDNDLDGIADADDKCPQKQEIINGTDDDDGCPDEGKQLVVVGEKKIVIQDKLYFANDREVILPRSEPVLAQLATTIERMPWLVKIRVAGHTDARGDDAHNKELSRRRAESVVRALVERGIDPKRLEAVGYGEEHPIDSNGTVTGRANNRRVEFVIIEQKQPPAGWEPAKGVEVK